MNTTIKYTGFTTQPSDYEAPDGQLAFSLNLINEDGAIKPLLSPKFVADFDDKTPVYIHTVTTGKIFLTKKVVQRATGDVLVIFYSMDPAGSQPVNLVSYQLGSDYTTSPIIDFASLGNILMILTTTGIDHFIWDSNTERYNPLGNSIPEIPLSFGLRGKVEYSEEYSTGINSVLEKDMYNEWVDETKSVITDAVLAKVNKFIADNATNKGRFIFPFFVRYALRLFDGSLINHSAPVLMHAATGETPNVLALSLDKQDGSDNHYEKMRFRIAAVCHQLDFQVIDNGQSLQQLKSKWSDIVKSVDIFISAPIYTFDPNGLCERFIENDVDDLRCTCRALDYEPGVNEGVYQQYASFPMYRRVFYNDIHDDMKAHFNRRCQLPPLSDSQSLNEKIKSTSQFFLLKSINIEELTDQRTLIEVPDDYLQSLVSREAMTDDYDSHDTYIAHTAYDYNSRINLANVRKHIFPGFSVTNALCFNNERGTNNDCHVIYYINDNGRTIITSSTIIPFGEIDNKLFLYHPSPNAFKAIIYRHENSSTIKKLECPLKQHDFLIGAFYFNEKGAPLQWQNLSSPAEEIQPSADSEQYVNSPNKIYTSTVNNPFVFPVTSITTVGSGEILQLATAAKALSQGQFGQFPLYVFTSEGVWALEVSATGTYSARQPISRDVCINPKAITQIDSGVVFPTHRGLMLLTGSQVQCFSNDINNLFPISFLNLPQFADYLLRPFSETNPVDDRLQPIPSFTTLLSDCRTAYDYTHQRLVIFFPNLPFSYVYSFKSNMWGILYATYYDALNSYPDALVVTQDNKVRNLCIDDRSSDTTIPALLLTRPLKLDSPDILKTIDTVIQRGNFARGNVSSVLYGSRDLINWHLVWSSKDHFLRGFRGTPYKYFRIALMANLRPEESIYGASVQFTPRLTDQPR